MPKLFLFMVSLCPVLLSIAQNRETFDMVTYTVPKNWKAEKKENLIGYTITDKSKKTWCQLGIYKNTASKGSIEKDFESEWNELAVKPYKASGLKTSEVASNDEWKIKVGGGKFQFNNADATVLLTTFTGYNRCISILAISNTENYINQVQDLLASVNLSIPDTTIFNVPSENSQIIVPNPSNAKIIGTWIKSGSANPVYGNSASWGTGGYTKDQYTFYENGTYTFFAKSFGYALTELILAKETGNFTINGNHLTVTPTSSIVESWSKKNGTDDWGKLTGRQKRALEISGYQFTLHYFSGIQQWNLVLQSANPTGRDGSFSTFTLFPNAYYYAPLSKNNTAIDLPVSD